MENTITNTITDIGTITEIKIYILRLIVRSVRPITTTIATDTGMEFAVPRYATNVAGSMIAVISTMAFIMAIVVIITVITLKRPEKLKSPKPKQSPYWQKVKNKYLKVVNDFGYI